MQGGSLTGMEIGEEDMYRLMKEQALSFIQDLFINMQEEEAGKHEQIARKIKTWMDRTFGPTWHCVVGKGFGSAVTYVNRHFIFLYIMNKAILIYKY